MTAGRLTLEPEERSLFLRIARGDARHPPGRLKPASGAGAGPGHSGLGLNRNTVLAAVAELEAQAGSPSPRAAPS